MTTAIETHRIEKTDIISSIIKDAQDAIELATGEKYQLSPVKVLKHGPVTFNKILREVSECFGVSEAAIVQKVRTDDVALARHAVCYMAYRVYKLGTLNFIGLRLSGRDHATIMHSIKTCEDLMSNKKVFKNRVQRCIDALEN